MNILTLNPVNTGIVIPEEGKRPASEAPLEYGLNQMAKTVCFAKVPDPNNIIVGTGTEIAALGATASLDLTPLYSIPIRWENAPGNKLKFRIQATLTCAYAQDLATLLATYNVIIFNKSIAATPYGGFLVLTIGDTASSADLKLSPACLKNGQFTAIVNKLSKEF